MSPEDKQIRAVILMVVGAVSAGGMALFAFFRLFGII